MRAASQPQAQLVERRARSAARGTPARRVLTGYALCLPAFLVVFAVLIYPVLYDAAVSLTDARDFEAGGDFVGFANYARALADPLYWEAARNTMVLVVVTSAVEVLVGAVTALLLWWRFWGRALVFLAVFVPWAFPTSFSAYAWYWLLLPPYHSFYSGPALALKFWLEGLFGNGAYAVMSIGIMNVWRGSSIIAIFLLAGLNAIPDELLDYGRLEARGSLRYLWSVVVPLVRRYLVLATLIGVATTYLDYVSMYVESGGRIIVPVIGTLAYQAGIQGGLGGYAAALNMTQLPVALLLVWLGLRFVERTAVPRPPPAGEIWRLERARPARPRAAPLAGGRSRPWQRRRRVLAGLGLLAALGVMAFHLFPIYYTGVQAVRPLDEFYLGQTLWAYHPDLGAVREALANPVLFRWGVNTLVVFGLVLALGLPMSMLAGYGLARFRVAAAHR